MARTITLKLKAGVRPHSRRRALAGIGSLSVVQPPVPTPAEIVDALGGIRATCRATQLGTDTLYRLQSGGGTLSSYGKLAAAVGMRVRIVEGKSARWKTLHASRDICWQTPPQIWQGALARLGIPQFDLDPCSPGPSSPIPCAERYTVADDGLSRSWGPAGSVAWVNPPYDRTLLPAWIDKMMTEAANGVLVVALVPARTGTTWWHRLLSAGARPEYLRGRVRFLAADGQEGAPAPFDSALIWLGVDGHDAWDQIDPRPVIGSVPQSLD